MIEYIQGKITSLTPVEAVIETAGGVAYLLCITLPTFDKLNGRDQARLFVSESIREDAWTLYGFADTDERELFRQLTGVSGVGAGTARMILSAIPAAELPGVIAGSDVRRLKAVKGVGAKTAERIIVDLRDKIKSPAAAVTAARGASSQQAYDEALAALGMLGFPRPASQKALDRIFADQPDVRVEQAIKSALTML